MSCVNKNYGTTQQSNQYLYSQFYSPFITSKNTKKCKITNGFYPNFKPYLNTLSQTTSVSGSYVSIFITGTNFLPNGTTFVKFGNYGYLTAIYYSSYNLSFIVPLNALPGTYDIKIVNLYNNNFSPTTNQSYPGNLNFSNSILYTIT